MSLRFTPGFVLYLLAYCLGTIGSSPSKSPPPGPSVNLGYAVFLGNDTSPTGELHGPVTFFGGIPYAQPPLGDLRFRAPEALDETEKPVDRITTTDARGWGQPCIQQPATVGVGSEDCLKINVWKPSDAKEGDKLPVMVYIYGGGFYAGNTQGFPLYDWVNQSNLKIIGVSMGYRLNVLGFLSGEEVQANGDLNAGILDQRAALEWVQRHIGKFGGDPSTVTIAGESAGGASVLMQVVAYGGEKPVPFKRAIAQSIGYGPTANSSLSRSLFETVAATAGCPTSGSESMSCLRNASIESIVAAINNVQTGIVSPVVDGPGGFLPELPVTLITQGRFSVVDFIGGHCTNDGRTFASSPATYTTDASVGTVITKRYPNVSNQTIQAALQLYPSPDTPGSPYTSQYDRAATMVQDTEFSCADWFLAEHLQSLGKGRSKLYNFRFNTPNSVLLAKAPYQGVMHTSDIYFLFDGTNSAPNGGFTFTPFNDTEKLVSEEIIAYWTSFASTGDPSAHKKEFSPTWTPFSTGRRVVMTEASDGASGTASTTEEISEDHIAKCRFWMSLQVAAQTEL